MDLIWSNILCDGVDVSRILAEYFEQVLQNVTDVRVVNINIVDNWHTLEIGD